MVKILKDQSFRYNFFVHKFALSGDSYSNTLFLITIYIYSTMPQPPILEQSEAEANKREPQPLILEQPEPEDKHLDKREQDLPILEQSEAEIKHLDKREQDLLHSIQKKSKKIRMQSSGTPKEVSRSSVVPPEVGSTLYRQNEYMIIGSDGDIQPPGVTMARRLANEDLKKHVLTDMHKSESDTHGLSEVATLELEVITDKIALSKWKKVTSLKMDIKGSEKSKEHYLEAIEGFITNCHYPGGKQEWFSNYFLLHCPPLEMQLISGSLGTVRRVLEIGASKMVQSALMRSLISTRKIRNPKNWALLQIFSRSSQIAVTQGTGFVPVLKPLTA